MDNYNTHNQGVNSMDDRSSVPPERPKKMGKFRASKMIAITCWNLLRQDTEIMLFPVIAFFVNIAIVIGFSIMMFSAGVFDGASATDSATAALSTLDYLFIFLFYIASYFSITFFEVGIVAIVNGRLNGNDLTFQDGIKAATGIAGKILVWSVLAATVGMILRMIAERSKMLGKIVVVLLGAAWSIVTYFVVPILYLDNLHIHDSLKQSALTIKKTWGETAILHIGVGFFFLIIGLAGVGLSILLMFLLSGIASVVIGFLLLIYLLVLAIASSAFGSIFKVVLYRYATTGVVPEGFARDTLELAFKQK